MLFPFYTSHPQPKNTIDKTLRFPYFHSLCDKTCTDIHVFYLSPLPLVFTMKLVYRTRRQILLQKVRTCVLAPESSSSVLRIHFCLTRERTKVHIWFLSLFSTCIKRSPFKKVILEMQNESRRGRHTAFAWPSQGNLRKTKFTFQQGLEGLACPCVFGVRGCHIYTCSQARSTHREPKAIYYQNPECESVLLYMKDWAPLNS